MVTLNPNQNGPAQSTSLWMKDGLIETQPLAGKISTDVCIVGGGISGLMIAVELLARGKSVVILSDSPIAGGETCRTTAHLVTALDTRYMKLELMHGTAGAWVAAQSHAAAIMHLESTVSLLNIDCDFRRLDGYLLLNDRHAHQKDELFGQELAACLAAGLGDIEEVPQLPGGWLSDLGPALRFPRQAQVHPTALVRGLVRHLLANGVRIYTGTHAADINGGPDAFVKTRDGAVVSCGEIVVATNTPINDRVAVHTKQSGYQSYVIAASVPAGALEPIVCWDGLWEDDEWYHYARLAKGDGGADLLILGGEDHKTGQGNNDTGQYDRLESWMRKFIPQAGAIEYRWSGMIMESADGLGYIGRNPLDADNVYITTGDSGNGMTYAAIAGMLIADLIMGRNNPWATLYDPARKIGLHSIADYAKENLNTAKQYGDWLRKGEVESESQIPLGTGAIISHGMRKLAVFKDSAGACTHLSAVCPHLGGVVRWNATEATWDCPCHASRFDALGNVIHGPANQNLAVAQVEEPVEGAQR